jgi:hypothetical protein
MRAKVVAELEYMTPIKLNLEVTYRWHPWYGERFWVRDEARRGGGAVLPRVREELNRPVSLEIPEWMVDTRIVAG